MISLRLDLISLHAWTSLGILLSGIFIFMFIVVVDDCDMFLGKGFYCVCFSVGVLGVSFFCCGSAFHFSLFVVM